LDEGAFDKNKGVTFYAKLRSRILKIANWSNASHTKVDEPPRLLMSNLTSHSDEGFLIQAQIADPQLPTPYCPVLHLLISSSLADNSASGMGNDTALAVG